MSLKFAPAWKYLRATHKAPLVLACDSQVRKTPIRGTWLMSLCRRCKVLGTLVVVAAWEAERSGRLSRCWGAGRKYVISHARDKSTLIHAKPPAGRLISSRNGTIECRQSYGQTFRLAVVIDPQPRATKVASDDRLWRMMQLQLLECSRSCRRSAPAFLVSIRQIAAFRVVERRDLMLASHSSCKVVDPYSVGVPALVR
jgi:hypothetical protein